MRNIFGDAQLDEKLWQLLGAGNSRDRAYIYRMQNGKPVLPAIMNCNPFPDLIDVLRDEHGGGEFRIMIRRGETMLLSGAIRIHPPLRGSLAT